MAARRAEELGAVLDRLQDAMLAGKDQRVRSLTALFALVDVTNNISYPYNNPVFREGEKCRHVTLPPFGKAA